MSHKVVLATNNSHKLTELRRVLAETQHEVTVMSLSDFPPYPEPAETEWTFAANALIKARAAAANTGLIALADDSGLEIDALNGCPGVRSARWAGTPSDDQANLELVLKQISDVPPSQRAGRFVCSMAIVAPTGEEHVLRAEWPGTIATEPRGEHGFGYDPIFIPQGFTSTSAEMSPSEKDAQSHRGQAVRAMIPILMDFVNELSGPTKDTSSGIEETGQ